MIAIGMKHQAQFTELLGRLKFDDEALEWVREALHASHADKRREQEEAISRLRTEYDRLQRRLDAMYVDKLDGRVDATFFDKKAAEWRSEQARCQREIDQHREADKSYMDEGVQILELARNRAAGTSPKTLAAQLCGIELHLGGGRSHPHLPPTI
jgi:site-specific DNA recombinase